MALQEIVDVVPPWLVGVGLTALIFPDLAHWRSILSLTPSELPSLIRVTT
jgi:hypothetical protein